MYGTHSLNSPGLYVEKPNKLQMKGEIEIQKCQQHVPYRKILIRNSCKIFFFDIFHVFFREQREMSG